MMKPLSVLTLFSFSACAAFADAPLPHPELLETTREIHALITKQAASAAKAYEEAVPKANGKRIALVAIPAGEFSVGSPDTEIGRKPDEGPQRKVKLDPFWMSSCEITWDLYRPFMENGKARNKDGTLNRDNQILTSDKVEKKDGETVVDIVTQPTPPYMPMNLGMGDGYAAGYPAVSMTQHAASKFCQWLSAQTGHFYRLPTEAEWEYACRAGTATGYSFGSDAIALADHAWFSENSEYQYQPVGKKKPNAWGLYDMHGNVAEHCLDQYLPDSYGKLTDGAANPLNLPVKRYPTVVRGGSWNDDAPALRSGARLGSDPAWKVIDPQLPKSLWYFTNAPWLGFRIVRPATIPSVEDMHRAWNTGPGDGND